jgi:predicted RNA binding protein YcfA (HicA-like mRNA interferase family)
MTVITGKALCKLVELHGWRLVRINGSHHIYMKAGINVRLSIPVHGNQSLKVGLLRHLLKQAGIDESDMRG